MHFSGLVHHSTVISNLAPPVMACINFQLANFIISKSLWIHKIFSGNTFILMLDEFDRYLCFMIISMQLSLRKIKFSLLNLKLDFKPCNFLSSKFNH